MTSVDGHHLTRLAAWKHEVCSRLVAEALPRLPEYNKTWQEVAVRAVYEYEKDPDKWQAGDPWFELYQDNFINKDYIYNQRKQIRELLRREGWEIAWVPGPGEGGLWLTNSPEEIERLLKIRRKRAISAVESYNDANKEQSTKHETVKEKPIRIFLDDGLAAEPA